MYNWYRRCAVCYAYLSDLEPNSEATLGSLQHCRWFSRGWTMQELIAPKAVVFFDGKWKEFGTKKALAQELSTITKIDSGILLGD